MSESVPPGSLPMGRLDAIEVGSRKLTIQTEFFHRPGWRIETKVYLGGELKKTYSEDVSGRAAGELQQSIDEFHSARCREMADALRALGK